MPYGRATQQQHGHPYRCVAVEGCEYTGFRYNVLQHFLNSHVPLGEVPYLCSECSGRLGTKQKADTHLRKCQPGRHFSEVFTGTYEDLKDGLIRRLTDNEAAEYRRAPRKRVNKPKLAIPVTEAARNAQLRRLMSPPVSSPPQKRPCLAEIKIEDRSGAPSAEEAGTSQDIPFESQQEDLSKKVVDPLVEHVVSMIFSEQDGQAPETQDDNVLVVPGSQNDGVPAVPDQGVNHSDQMQEIEDGEDQGVNHPEQMQEVEDGEDQGVNNPDQMQEVEDDEVNEEANQESDHDTAREDAEMEDPHDDEQPQEASPVSEPTQAMPERHLEDSVNHSQLSTPEASNTLERKDVGTSTDVEQLPLEDEIDVSPGESIDPPIIELLHSIDANLSKLATSQADLVEQQRKAGEREDRLLEVIERMAVVMERSPGPPPLLSAPVSLSSQSKNSSRDVGRSSSSLHHSKGSSHSRSSGHSNRHSSSGQGSKSGSSSGGQGSKSGSSSGHRHSNVSSKRK